MRLKDALPAVQEAIRTLETAVEWHCLDAPARTAQIKPVVARAIETDYVIEDRWSHVQEGSHLGLEGGQQGEEWVSKCGTTYTVVGLLAPLLRWLARDCILCDSTVRFLAIETRFQWAVIAGGVFYFKKGEGIHSNAFRLARGCDTSLQQSRVLGLDVRRTFVVRIRDGNGTNFDTFSLLDPDLDAVGGVSMSFGHGEERGRDVDRVTTYAFNTRQTACNMINNVLLPPYVQPSEIHCKLVYPKE